MGDLEAATSVQLSAAKPRPGAMAQQDWIPDAGRRGELSIARLNAVMWNGYVCHAAAWRPGGFSVRERRA